mmetsp:Transcript_116068/g.369305  ORF Transcript_116068/g.369305 Transcript_116068/m.369305 type:complete len:292 (+) Transcript_116068:174-1049(+)
MSTTRSPFRDPVRDLSSPGVQSIRSESRCQRIAILQLHRVLEPAPSHPADLAHERREVDGSGGAVEPEAAHDEVLRFNCARTVLVQQPEETTCFGRVQIDGLEVVLHGSALELALEAVPLEAVGAGDLHGLDGLAQAVQQVDAVLLCGLGEGRANEDAGDHIEHRQDSEGDVDAEYKSHDRTGSPNQGVHHVLPVDSTCHRLVKRQDRTVQGAKEHVGLGALFDPLWIVHSAVGHHLCEANPGDIDQKQQQQHNPEERHQCASDRVHHGSQFPYEAQYPHHPNDAHKPQHT